MRSSRTRRGLWVILSVCLLAQAVTAASSLEEAYALQRRGKLREARDLFRRASNDLRASGDQEKTATALSEAARISVSLGDYPGAISDAEKAIALRRGSPGGSELSADYNTVGLANRYLGNSPTALENYQAALKIDRAGHDVSGEVTRLNNIGGVYFLQGRYSTSLEAYQGALLRVSALPAELYPWGLQLTVANTAILYQRVGLDARALELYKQFSGKAKTMPASEYAQILLNEKALYRRLGDPIKALEMYRTAQRMLRCDRHPDAEIGAWRNIGIVKTMDLEDLHGALDAFQQALKLARQSANNRGVVQANLYRGEVLRRLQRFPEANASFAAALAGAERAGLVEDQWKSLY